MRAAVEADGEGIDAAPAAGAADAELGQAYRTAHDRVLAELDGDRYHASPHGLDGLVTSPPLTERAAAKAGKVLPRLVARSYADVRKIVAQADATPAGPNARNCCTTPARPPSARATPVSR